MFDKLVDQVDDAVFQAVSEHLEEAMGGSFDEESHDAHSIVRERVLIALLKKFRPEGVIFVEDEKPQIVYGVHNSQGTWICDVSGTTEGELFDDFVDAMNDVADGGCMAQADFEVGQEFIKMIDQNNGTYILKKKS